MSFIQHGKLRDFMTAERSGADPQKCPDGHIYNDDLWARLSSKALTGIVCILAHRNCGEENCSMRPFACSKITCDIIKCLLTIVCTKHLYNLHTETFPLIPQNLQPMLTLLVRQACMLNTPLRQLLPPMQRHPSVSHHDLIELVRQIRSVVRNAPS